MLFSARGKEVLLEMDDYVYDADEEQLNYEFNLSTDKVVHLVYHVFSYMTVGWGACSRRFLNSYTRFLQLPKGFFTFSASRQQTGSSFRSLSHISGQLL